MVSIFGYILSKIDLVWNNLRTFSFRNKTFLEMFFVLVYSFEQLILLILTFTAETVLEISLYVSIFAIVVLITFSLHSFVKESRIKILENKLSIIEAEKNSFKKKFIVVNERYEDFLLSVSKDLNKNK